MPVEFTGMASNSGLHNYPLVIVLKHPELDVWRRLVFSIHGDEKLNEALTKQVNDLMAAGWTDTQHDGNTAANSLRPGAVEIIRL